MIFDISRNGLFFFLLLVYQEITGASRFAVIEEDIS
jgi:hypothetical protein